MIIMMTKEGKQVMNLASLLTEMFDLSPQSELWLSAKKQTGAMFQVEVGGTADICDQWQVFQRIVQATPLEPSVLNIPDDDVPFMIDPKYGKQDADSLLFLKHFDLPKGSKCLEVGANEESLAAILSDNGYDVTGIDLRPHQFRLPHPYNRIEGDFLKIAPLLQPGQFDAIYSTSALEHFGLCCYGREEPDDIQDFRAMCWIYQLLRPGGKCFLTVPYGKQFLANSDWRVYNEAALRERFIRTFKVEKMIFFKSGACDCPSENGYVRKEDADRYSGDPPHVTVLLVMIKP